VHNANVKSWSELEGETRLIIGAFESGMDAAVNLVEAGKRVTIFSAAPKLATLSQDPSRSLSPYTKERMRQAILADGMDVETNAKVVGVARHKEGFMVELESGDSWITDQPPILATGFVSSLTLIRPHFEWRDEDYCLLSENDESTKTPGLFLVGPQVRHSTPSCTKPKHLHDVALGNILLNQGIPVDQPILQRHTTQILS